MNIEQVRDYTLSLPGVTEDQPFGDDILTFRLEGKIFVCLWLGGGKHDMKESLEPRLALKLSPERNEELRSQFAAVTPAWHWNKKHWSDVYYEQIDDAFVQAWIKESYQLVASKLPKALRLKYIAFAFVFIALFFCSCNHNKVNETPSAEVTTEDTLSTITQEMAYEGINNYCHSAYDWSVAENNPEIMSLTLGEETDSTYQVVFRSYTGAFVHFYVNKTSGTTRIVEKVPTLNVEEDAGTIELFDYLN